MPKKAKASDTQTAPSDGAALNGNAAKPAAKKVRAPRKKAATQKTPATKKETSRVSDEAIRIRAYFISEQRERLAIPGDANSDWIEARRQLLAELGES
jgi:xanthine dehydrogenase molybdopterin-binding subunit B